MRSMLVLALVVGCGGGNQAPVVEAGSGSVSKPTTDLTGDCKTDATAVGAFLAAMPHEAGVFQKQRGVELVKRDDLPIASIAFAPVVIANPELITFQGQLVDRASLEEHLKLAQAKLTGSPVPGDTSAKRLYLYLDAATPWSKVVDIVEVAEAAGFTEPAFLFDIGFKLTPPPRSKVDDELDALQRDTEAGNKATKLAEITRNVIQPCPSLISLFGGVASADGDKGQYLIDGVGKALIDCDCKADVASVRSVLWRVLATAPTVQVIAFDASRTTRLELPGTTTWAEASKRFKPGTKGMQLVAK